MYIIKFKQKFDVDELTYSMCDANFYQWVTIEFVVKPFKEVKDCYVLGGVDDVIAALDESMVTMNTITSSRYTQIPPNTINYQAPTLRVSKHYEIVPLKKMILIQYWYTPSILLQTLGRLANNYIHKISAPHTRGDHYWNFRNHVR